MKKWVLLIFSINKSLDKQCERLEKKIEKLSLNSAMPTGKLYAEIAKLGSKKADLINLRVLYNMMCESLCAADIAILECVAERGRSSLRGFRGLGFRDSGAGGAGVVGAVSGKRIFEILSVCEHAAAKACYTAEKFERLYPQLAGMRVA